MATNAAWTQRPLPPGWEAKYDQRSRKYFFVNHQTKTTQWVDPRIAYYANQPSPAMMHRPPPERIALQPISKPKCKTCKTNDAPAAGRECRECQIKSQQREAALVRAREEREAEQKRREQEQRIKQEQERRRVQSAKRRSPQPPVLETSFGMDDDEDHLDEVPTLTMTEKIKLVNDLDEIYTDVTRTVIDMVLESCQYKKQTAMSVLNSMSSKKAPQAAVTKAPSSPAAAVARSATPPAAAVARSASPPAAAVARSATPPAAAVARAASPPAAAVARAASPPAASSSSSAAKPKSSPARGEPKPAKPKELTAAQKAKVRAALQKAFPHATSSMITMALETTKYDQALATGVLRMLKDDTKAKTTTSGGSRPTTSSSTSSASSRAPSATVKSVTTTITEPSAPKKAVAAHKAKGAKRTRVKTAAPETTKSEFTSSYSTTAQGRDPSLAKGPNKDLLIDNYVHEGGADPTLRHGPDPTNVSGSSEMSTKSSSLASGPQASLRSGPQQGLAKGSLYQGDRQS